jgi:Tfp pilus assembly protein PilZ
MNTYQSEFDKYSVIAKTYKLINGLADDQKMLFLKQLLQSDLDTHLLKLILDMTPYQQISILNQLEEMSREVEPTAETVVEINIDERRAPRKPLPVFVELFSGDKCFTEEMLDISIGGAFIRTQRDMDPGQEVDISFSLPEKDSALVMKAKIVRSTQDGIGVKFINLKQDEYELIKKFMEDMERL